MPELGEDLLGQTRDLASVGARQFAPLSHSLPAPLTHHPSQLSLIADLLHLLVGPTPALPGGDRAELHEPLTESEKRVLRYLPTALTAPEIAAELYLSVNTVKTHMRHVYAKLRAHRRTEAVEQARALGLLPRTG